MHNIAGDHSLVRQWLEKLQTMARAGDLRKSYGGALDFEVARCISVLLREISEQHGILDRTHGNHGIRDHELWTNDACVFPLIDNEVCVIFHTAAGGGPVTFSRRVFKESKTVCWPYIYNYILLATPGGSAALLDGAGSCYSCYTDSCVLTAYSRALIEPPLDFRSRQYCIAM